MEQMNKNGLIKLMVESKAIRYGEFTLSSGKKSTYYFDGKKLSLGSKALTAVVTMLAREIRELCPTVDAIGGPELGAVALVGGLLVHHGITRDLLGHENDMRGFICRKESKKHGLKEIIEGTLDPERVHKVCVIEDVTTTGGSALRAVNHVEALGHEVLVVAAIVDRQEGARQLFEGRGIRFISLLNASDIVKKEAVEPDWDEDR